ncbi:uncharacterized protein LOC132721721 [Ruditapes philippinarum]|uniref:uncharacterized protein LOC132721721 n=1 Tax=Ruditapes philippinarum TaxID=129788 RepID=UPI00295B1CA6|nr:uncharacterized protein LOC132721721 [Ruditapes philippinarum]
MIITFVLAYLELAYAVRVVKFGLSDGNVPEKGKDISMLCEVEISVDDGIQALNILKEDTKIADCFFNAGNIPCSKAHGVSTRYTFTNNQPSVNISITNLQISDGGNWYCGFQTTSHTLTLMIYSSPDSVVLSGSHRPEDLSIKGVDFTCQTSNCIYPAPLNYQWFYKSGDTWILYQNSSPTHSDTTCSGNEKVYHSTLSFARNTVWPLHPVNADITVKFQCRLDFPTLTSSLQSTDSNNVRYAVQVTSVTLNDGNKTLLSSETIVMINGSSKTFTCATGTSRPVSTIVWYVGSTSVQRSTSTAFTYTAGLEDNNTTLRCKAFNIQDEANAVSSTTPSFRILERTIVKSFFIGQNESQTNAIFDEHEVDIQFTCVVSGIPASEVYIIFRDEIIAKQSNTNKLIYNLQDIGCTKSGIYVCKGIDAFGTSTNKTSSVYIECSPRPLRQVFHNVTSSLGVPVRLSFIAIAYPEPGPKGFLWSKEDRHNWVSLLSNEDFQISSSGLETNLTILNVSQEHYGKYRVTTVNRIGSYDQIMFLSETSETDHKPDICKSCTETRTFTASIILGVVCVVLVGYATGLTILYRRNISKKGAAAIIHGSNSKTGNDNTRNTTNISEVEHFESNAAEIDEESSKQYTELTPYSNEGAAYEQLQT